MNDKKNYLTPKGLENLKSEIEKVQKVKRPEVVARLAQAREMGDLSENAEYQAAKEELAFIDGRIEELEGMLKQVIVIENAGHHGGKIVDIGSRVAVKIKDRKEVFTVVGEWEADPTEKRISHESPLGKALMGKAVGDDIEVEAPSGKIIYTVVQIS